MTPSKNRSREQRVCRRRDRLEVFANEAAATKLEALRLLEVSAVRQCVLKVFAAVAGIAAANLSPAVAAWIATHL